MTTGDAVGFDFEGSLQLARQLWQLADLIQSEDADREVDADTATAKFEGPHADSFVARREQERTSRTTVISALRDDARNWAEAWATAMDQQNKNNRAARVEEIRENRGALERFGDLFVGDDSDEQVPMPDPVAVPSAPDFAPTATPNVY
ncbi:hypothetical protein [Actinomarinicola tropica]|uniref:PPE domain-containing protein n=1 Tax=Actinomarinicola tropica TaxID=2789776 RepID=A0A5Q2RGA8_9ACTN|nr:hypothetical protein [Actinomarinicola tropica]QGG93641.1 hypothetical protein GH723_00120 [Actinomarinicola tropica]